jgi:hypothetical protein
VRKLRAAIHRAALIVNESRFYSGCSISTDYMMTKCKSAIDQLAMQQDLRDLRSGKT